MAQNPKRKKRSVIGARAALAKLDRMIPILKTNIEGALRIEATLEAGNDIVRKMPDKAIPGAQAYNTIRNCLAFDLSMHLARLFDKGSKHYPANKKDAASIPLMIRLLRQKRCQRMLADRARNWSPSLAQTLGAQFERDCIKAIDDASKAYTSTFRGKFGQSGLKRLKDAHDNHFAHSLMKDKKIELIYNHLYRLTDCARDILEHASVAIAGHNLSLVKFEEHYREEADEFWNKALLGKEFDKWAMTDESDPAQPSSEQL